MDTLKEMVSIEFRYSSVTLENRHVCKTITLGIFDDLITAVAEGNRALKKLSETFEVREKFKVKGLFGSPVRLITNWCYPTNDIAYFAKITRLSFEDLDLTIETILNEAK